MSQALLAAFILPAPSPSEPFGRAQRNEILQSTGDNAVVVTVECLGNEAGS